MVELIRSTYAASYDRLDDLPEEFKFHTRGWKVDHVREPDVILAWPASPHAADALP